MPLSQKIATYPITDLLVACVTILEQFLSIDENEPEKPYGGTYGFTYLLTFGIVGLA